MVCLHEICHTAQELLINTHQISFTRKTSEKKIWNETDQLADVRGETGGNLPNSTRNISKNSMSKP